jgi:hypothetical protein
MFYSRGSARVWLLVVASVIILIVGVVVVARLLSPEPLSPLIDGDEKPPGVRSVVITDDEVLPLLPVEGARFHFMPGNKIQIGYKSIPFQPTISCGVSEGMLWFSGIPSWLDLSRVDKTIDNYLSQWTPAWSFTVDTSATSVTSTIAPEDGLCTANATPTFCWASIAGESGAKYSLEVDNDTDFSSPVLARSKLYSLDYTLTDEEALANGSYYWRVMQRGKLWIIGMPPWLDISAYDPEVTELPTIVSVKTGEGEVKISYLP